MAAAAGGAPASPPKTDFKGSVVLVVNKRGLILFGYESVYKYEDKTAPAGYKNGPHRKTGLDPAVGLTDYSARVKATTDVIKQLETAGFFTKGNLVGLVMPSKAPVGGGGGAGGAPAMKTWSTHVRKPGGKAGFPKGSREGTETRLETAQREFAEEIGQPEGVVITNDHYAGDVSTGQGDYAVFVVTVNDAQQKAVEGEIKKRHDAGIGEMYDLKFESSLGLLPLQSTFNPVSQNVYKNRGTLLDAVKTRVTAAAAAAVAATSAAATGGGAAGGTGGGGTGKGHAGGGRRRTARRRRNRRGSSRRRRSN